MNFLIVLTWLPFSRPLLTNNPFFHLFLTILFLTFFLTLCHKVSLSLVFQDFLFFIRIFQQFVTMISVNFFKCLFALIFIFQAIFIFSLFGIKSHLIFITTSFDKIFRLVKTGFCFLTRFFSNLITIFSACTSSLKHLTCLFSLSR